MSRRIVLASIAVGLALVGVSLTIGGMARADDPPPTLDLSKTLDSTPVYSIDITEGLSVTLPVSNRVESRAQITVTAKLDEIVEVATGESAAGIFGLMPLSQTAEAGKVLAFALSLKETEQPTVTRLYTGLLTLVTTGPDVTPTVTTTQPFTLNVMVPAPEREAPMTPTLPLRLVGDNGELLSSPPVYRVLVSDDGGWISTVLGVYNVGSEDLAIAAGPLTLTTATGDVPPATLGLAPVSQTLKADEVVTISLFLTDGWLPAGRYSASVRFSAEGMGPLTEPLVLLVSPWEAQLEWAQEVFVYEADEAHTEATIQFLARYSDAKDISAQLPAVKPKGVQTTPFSTKDFLTIRPSSRPSLTQDRITTFTLSFITSTLPTPGKYEGELQLSANNAVPITAPFTLIVPDSARGSYRINCAGLGPTPRISPTMWVTETEALQFTGVRWLPGSSHVIGSWWPVVAGALLLGLSLALLTHYAWWSLEAPGPNGTAGKGIGPAEVFGAVTVAIVLVLGLGLGLFQGGVGERTLLVWETERRGPVRNVVVQGGEVTSEFGHTGSIGIGEYDKRIDAGGVLTVPIDIAGLPHPGAYAGKIVIQSPDIRDGVKTVPVQVTVHDFILWPALVILLGVALGGYVNYRKDIISGRLAQRKAIEEVRQEWDDHMVTDNYRLCWLQWASEESRMNPIYGEVFWKLDSALGLLKLDPEWGAANAQSVVGRVRRLLRRYQRLSNEVAELAEATGWGDESASEWLYKAEDALCSGLLDRAANAVGQINRERLPNCITQLGTKLEEVKDEKLKKTVKVLLTKARELCISGDYGQAWELYKEAEYAILAQGTRVPRCKPCKPRALPSPDYGYAYEEDDEYYGQYEDDRSATRRARMRELRGKYYKISATWSRRRVDDTVLLRLIYVGPEFEYRDVTPKWSVKPTSKMEIHSEYEFDTTARLCDEGSCTIEAVVYDETGQLHIADQPEPLRFDIEPSQMEAIYRDKRRHTFYLQLAAGLIALVGGMVARRVFDLTFGSIEDYLLAFGWGVGANAGTQRVARMSDGFNAMLGKVYLIPKWMRNEEA
jgi:hypothetical protein